MDERKFNTQELLAQGILNVPAPKTRRPESALKVVDDFDPPKEEELQQGLKEGGLTANQYYGCWSIWQTGAESYDGELLQYRVVTEEFQSLPLDEALAKAKEWLSACIG